MKPINKMAAIVMFIPMYGFNDPVELVSVADLPWAVRALWKCPRCGRRTSTMVKGVGAVPLVLTMRCKFGHEIQSTPTKVHKLNGTRFFYLNSAPVKDMVLC